MKLHIYPNNLISLRAPYYYRRACCSTYLSAEERSSFLVELSVCLWQDIFPLVGLVVPLIAGARIITKLIWFNFSPHPYQTCHLLKKDQDPLEVEVLSLSSWRVSTRRSIIIQPGSIPEQGRPLYFHLYHNRPQRMGRPSTTSDGNTILPGLAKQFISFKLSCELACLYLSLSG